jgi:hypothetical protein
MSQIRAGIGQGGESVSTEPDPVDPNTAMGRAYGLKNFLLQPGQAVPPDGPRPAGTSGTPVRFSASLVECKIFPCGAR